jgi:hypothetical protein
MTRKFILAGLLLGTVLTFTLGIYKGSDPAQPGRYQLAATFDGSEVVLIRMNTQTGAIDVCRRPIVKISDREPTVQVTPAQP